MLGGQLQACAAIGAKGLGQVAAFAKAWRVDIDVSGGLQINLLEILHPGIEHSVDDLGGVLGVDADRVFDVDLGAFDFDIEEAAGGGLFELDAYCYGIAFEVGLIKVGIRAARREAGQATRMDDFHFWSKASPKVSGRTSVISIAACRPLSAPTSPIGGGVVTGLEVSVVAVLAVGVSSLGLSGVAVLVVEGVCSIASTGALASVLAGAVVSLVLASETPSVSVGRLVTGGLTPPPIVELIARPPRVVVPSLAQPRGQMEREIEGGLIGLI